MLVRADRRGWVSRRIADISEGQGRDMSLTGEQQG